MKPQLIFLFAAVTFSNGLFAQKNAVTDDGVQVVLYDNGTWKYVNDSSGQGGDSASSIGMNPKVYSKDLRSTFLLKSTKFDGLGVWLDPKKWSFKKVEDGSAPEYKLELKDESAYAMIITEKMSIPLETLRAVALTNAQKVAPDTRITHQEYRTVNGLKVLNLQLKGTIQGIKFEYFGYYYSNDRCTAQFVTYFSQGEAETYRPIAEQLVNGMVMAQPQK